MSQEPSVQPGKPTAATGVSSDRPWSTSVEKIVRHYMGRLESMLQGLPRDDRDELLREVHSHIYESYQDRPGENEIDRILDALTRLGEPAEVVSGLISPALVRMGRVRRIPFYMGAGALLIFAGLPLGLTATVFLLAVALAVAAVILVYYATAVSLAAVGALGFFITMIKYISPTLAVEIGRILHLRGPDMDNLAARLLLSLVLLSLGLFLLWLSRYLTRGLRFFFRFIGTKVKEYRAGRRVQSHRSPF
jgi:uncharacterized membrane protein